MFNLLNYKLTNKINDRLIRWLFSSINLNGCILIKIVQWINTNLDLLDIKNDKILYKIFNRFYEDCDIHDLQYTKKIFLNEFKENFDEVIQLDNFYNIKSGSIAQVYKGFYNNKMVALKVVHPDIKYQLIFPIFFIKLYSFLVKNVFFLKSYDTHFVFDSFFNNLKNQTNMQNEYNNMKYFYDTYKENEYILIPEPLQATKNILMMDFLDGEKLELLDISLLEKQKIVNILNLFLKDTHYFKDYYHSDLHESNWKVVKYNDFYKIIIYDFGYISINNLSQTFKDITYFNDILDVDSMVNTLYYHCKNIRFTNEEFRNKFKKYLEDSKVKFREPFCDELILRLYNFIVIYDICLQPNMFELFISMILFKKNILKYICLKKVGISNSNILVSTYLNSIQMCKKYNFFDDVRNYYEEKYINNPEIKKLHQFENNYFQDLGSSNSIDI
jgi:predicted unusual protein kinase regulating ubiquinone biosynthesis (AarF/ABC1/UbiB family)